MGVVATPNSLDMVERPVGDEDVELGDDEQSIAIVVVSYYNSKYFTQGVTESFDG